MYNVVADDFDRRRIRLPVLAWKDSSFVKRVELRISTIRWNLKHTTFSDTSGGQGVQTAMEYTISFDKECTSGFFMFSIHVLLEREVDHQAPRHLVDGISMWLTTMMDKFLRFEEEITASHLLLLRIRLLAKANESTGVICWLQSARLVERV